MNKTIWVKRLKWAGAICAVVVVSAAAFLAGRMTGKASPEKKTPSVAAGKERTQTQIWTCSMHPQIRKTKPGKCPICHMDLVPLKAAGGEQEGLRRFVTTKAAAALMDIQTAPVERRFVTAEIRMVGKVTYDETRLAYITAWVPGRLDRLFVDYTGITVKKGDHMVFLYSPELLSTQEELLQALELVRGQRGKKSGFSWESANDMLAAVRDKLRLLGLTTEQIAAIEKRGKPSDHITIYAPIGGIVVHKNAQQGMYVKTGTRIYTIADLSQVWVKLDAYESDLVWLRYGQKVSLASEAYPGETFTGKIVFIDPILDAKTRTVKVRVNAPNREGKLKPEMFVHAVVKAQVAAGGKVMDPELAGKWMCPMHPDVVKPSAGKCDICGMPLVRTETLGFVSPQSGPEAKPLVIPASAALVTGRRAVVYVKVPGIEKPTFEGRVVVLGPRAGDYYIVKSNLAEGEFVVTNGNFKIDSALQIRAKPSMMTPEGGGGGAGHAHHGGAMKKTARKMPGMGKLAVPGVFRDELRALQAAHDSISAALKSGDLEKTKSAFAALKHALDRMDDSPLSGKARAAWRELAMQLVNDAVEGTEASSLAEARRFHNGVTTGMRKLHATFRVARKLQTPAAFRQGLTKLFEEYLATAAALASDDFSKASKAANSAANALSAVDMKLLSGEAHMQWMKLEADLRKALDAMVAAKDLEGLRQGFALFSEAMPPAIRRFGIRPVDPVYRFRCSMAFDGRGAGWLQTKRETLNPYFGKTMPKCGEIVETVYAPARGGKRR